LTFLDLRRSEVLALTWDRINFEAGTVTIDRARTVGPAGGPRTVVDAPKSQRSRRVIPLPNDVLAALRTTKRQQQLERLALGRPLNETDLVVVDEAGRGVDPDTYTKAFKTHLKAAGLPETRLHDARRTAATLLHVAYGVPANAAASYLGHDPATYNDVYVNGDTGHDLVAEALSRMQSGVGA
jgi:integrase